MDLSRSAKMLFTFIASIALMIFTKAVFIPLVLAVVVWFLVRLLRRHMARITVFGHGMPLGMRNLLSFIAIAGVLFFIIHILLRNIGQIGASLQNYEESALKVKRQVEAAVGMDLNEVLAEIDLGAAVTMVVNSITDLLRSGVLILIYVVFIMLEERQIRKKLQALIPDDKSRSRNEEVLGRIDASLSHYVTIKTFTSFLTGLLSYGALLVMEVDHAFFWGLCIFVLNYIPTVGSLVATSFPAMMAAIQFGSYVPALWVLGVVGVIQLLVGNVLEPRIVGSSLNISPLVVLLMLTLWGLIWGVVGMLLSAPITVALVIVLAQFDRTRWLAILLSDKGKVDQCEHAPKRKWGGPTSAPAQ